VFSVQSSRGYVRKPGGESASEAEKCGHEFCETWSRKWIRWRGPAPFINDRTILSSERAANMNRRTADTNNNLILDPKELWEGGLGTNIDNWCSDSFISYIYVAYPDDLQLMVRTRREEEEKSKL
jgi:hypothetical protein